MTVVIDTSPAEQIVRARRDTIARRKRLLRRGRGCALWAVPLAILTGVGTWFVLEAIAWADQRAGERALAEARAGGAPLEANELRALRPTSPQIAEATRFWRLALERTDLGIFHDPDLRKVPVIGDSRSDQSQDPPDRDARGHLQGEDLIAATMFLAPFEEAFVAARSARDAGGVANFEEPPEGQAVAAPVNINALLMVAIALRLKVETQLAGDDLDGAVDDVATLMAVGDSYRYEPYLWYQRNRHQIVEWAIDLLERMQAVENLNDDHLKRLAEAFRERDEAESFRLALAGSRIGFVDFVEQADEGFTQSLEIDHSSWSRGADLAKGLDLFRQIDEASEQGLIEANRRWSTIEAEVTSLAAVPSSRTRYPATFVFFPQTGPQVQSHLNAEASLALARTAIACERYRLARGKLPAKLADLAPEFLPKTPLDPCDGKPLRYVNAARGTQLYSVGADGVDQGGGAPAGSGAALFTSSDVVFQLKKTKPKAEASASP